MQIIQNVIDESSPYAVISTCMKLSKKNKGLHVQKIEHQERWDFILNVVLHDQRRYNEPTHYEVAAVFIGEDGAPPANRDVVIYPK